MPSTLAVAPAAHELLLRLAGRVPDELLWRLRDWVAGGDDVAVGAFLPRALLRHRIGVTTQERDLLDEVVPAGSASHRLVGAVLDGPVPEPPAFGHGEPDLAAWSAVSVARDDAREIRLAVRADGARVLVVRTEDRPHALTATLQRLLRVHGEHVPRVEAWAGDRPPSPYQEAAETAAVSLWSRPTAPTG